MKATGLLASISIIAAACGSTPTTETEPGRTMTLHVEGHRGARGLKPESSLQAFEAALDIGVTVLELDLHRLSDGEIVVWHDNNYGDDKCRYADGSQYPERGLPVASLTTADLAAIRCDINPDANRFPDQDNGPTQLAGSEYRPPTLAELFEFVEAYSTSPDKSDEQKAGAASVGYNIETKRETDFPEGIGDDFDGVSPGDFELRALSIIDTAGLTDRVVIQSFDHRSLWAIRSVDPTIRLSALTFAAPDLADYAERGATIWSPDFNTLTRALIDRAHSLDLLVLPWTVNSPDDMNRVLEMGVDGFITDRPDLAVGLNS